MGFENFARKLLANLRVQTPTAPLQHHPVKPDSPLERIVKEMMRRPTAEISGAIRFSVLLPIYKTPERFFKEATDSVLQQSYTNWELCIYDDGSDDDRLFALAEQLASRDSRVKLKFGKQNKGIAASTQAASEIATGDYIVILDHDDKIVPSALSSIADMLSAQPELDFVYSDHINITDDGDAIDLALKPDWSPELFLSTNFCVHLKAIRRSLFERIGGFNDTIHLAQDTGLILKMVEAGAKVRHCPKPLYMWRAHNGSVAAGIDAKPEIGVAGRNTLNNFLVRKGSQVRAIWPDALKKDKLGAYKLDFSQVDLPKIAIIAVDLDGSVNVHNLTTLLEDATRQASAELHVMSTRGTQISETLPASMYVHTITDQKSFDDTVSDLDADWLIFVTATTRYLHPNWLKEITGYLALSGDIGACGGKALDHNLLVRSGGICVGAGFPVIGGGNWDQYNGYWLNGRIASNVEAVMPRFMATRRDVYLRVRGLPVFRYGDAAGIAYGVKLRKAGLRVVYNPWAKVADLHQEPKYQPNFRDLLSEDFSDEATVDRYYHPYFSSASAYTLV